MPLLAFSSKHPDLAWLSPKYPVDISIEGERWPSVEHFYQAMSTTDLVLRQRIRSAATAGEARSLAHTEPNRWNWEKLRLDYMRQALRAKFGQHDELWERLEATAGHQLVYASDDAFWGHGPDAVSGENQLGRLLMELRDGDPAPPPASHARPGSGGPGRGAGR
jgi:hypothetical protein